MSRDRDDDRKQSRTENTTDARAVAARRDIEARERAIGQERVRDVFQKKSGDGITPSDSVWGAERLRMDQEVAQIRENVKELRPEVWRGLNKDENGLPMPDSAEYERKIDALRRVGRILGTLQGWELVKIEYWPQDDRDRFQDLIHNAKWESRYLFDTNTIHIRTDVLKKEDSREALESCLHEIRHKFQDSVVKDPTAHPEINAKTVELWQHGMETYPRWKPTNTTEAKAYRQEYLENAIEKDARAYSEHQMSKIYDERE